MTIDVLTASRQASLLRCMRQHYWRFELKLKRQAEAAALRFGSAWHKAMEVRTQGGTIEAAFSAAIQDAMDNERRLDELQVATLSGMLAGYYAQYEGDPVLVTHPEVEFRLPIHGSRAFVTAGKIDGLMVMNDGTTSLREYKTSGSDIQPQSDYWLRLRCNAQIMQYVWAARQSGWDVNTIIYDVARKPMIEPRQVPQLDDQGRKIVHDAQGNRVFKKDGTPRESAGEGMTLQSVTETPDQFADRLFADTKERPFFYFARREVPVMDDDLAEFLVQRLELARLILSLRKASRRLPRPEQAWPRNVDISTCRGCEYCDFCLQGVRVDATCPPSGFVIADTNTPELSNNTTGENA